MEMLLSEILDQSALVIENRLPTDPDLVREIYSEIGHINATAHFFEGVELEWFRDPIKGVTEALDRLEELQEGLGDDPEGNVTRAEIAAISVVRRRIGKAKPRLRRAIAIIGMGMLFAGGLDAQVCDFDVRQNHPSGTSRWRVMVDGDTIPSSGNNSIDTAIRSMKGMLQTTPAGTRIRVVYDVVYFCPSTLPPPTPSNFAWDTVIQIPASVTFDSIGQSVMTYMVGILGGVAYHCSPGGVLVEVDGENTSRAYTSKPDSIVITPNGRTLSESCDPTLWPVITP